MSRAASRAPRHVARSRRQPVDRGPIRFIVRFLAAWAAFLLVLGLVPGIQDLFVRATVASLTWAGRWYDPHATSHGTIYDSAGTIFQIVPDCTPLMPWMVFATACLAFPAPWRARVAGLLGAGLVLWVYNLARILLLIEVKRHWPGAFGFAHTYLWQTTTLLMVFALFAAWLGARDALVRRGPPAPAAPAGAV